MIHDIATLGLLMGLELVLGIDNILVISLLVANLPASQQSKTRNIGLVLALLCRLLMLLGASALVQMKDPVLLNMSWRDLILFVGGLFLIYKAVTEIHHTVEGVNDVSLKKKSSAKSIVFQIIMLDIVFSVDSVITAVGMTDNMWVIVSSVILSFGLVLAYSRKISDFITDNPGIKILALSFLVTIGVTLFMEAFHTDIPKAYIYLPMGFALVVEMLQIRHSKNLAKSKRASR